MTPFSVSGYAIECWEQQHGIKFVRELASADWSESYECDAAHVFELADGKYAFIRESGCSCYSYDDAYIKICDTADEAMDLYKKEVK